MRRCFVNAIRSPRRLAACPPEFAERPVAALPRTAAPPRTTRAAAFGPPGGRLCRTAGGSQRAAVNPANPRHAQFGRALMRRCFMKAMRSQQAARGVPVVNTANLRHAQFGRALMRRCFVNAIRSPRRLAACPPEFAERPVAALPRTASPLAVEFFPSGESVRMVVTEMPCTMKSSPGSRPSASTASSASSNAG